MVRVPRSVSWFYAAVGLSFSCAHAPLSASALNEVTGVALLGRIEEEAGPKSTVFRDDSSYRPKLAPRHIDDKEADRRLAQVLSQGTFERDKEGKRLVARTLSRFELADSLRSELLSMLPKRKPWSEAANPAQVATQLESFLVQEVPANIPDYERLAQLGVDTIVEIVIHDYGMHSRNGRAGVYLDGTAHMFRLGGGEIYHRHFVVDDLSAGSPHLDPFAVAKNATLFADRMKPILASVAQQIAADLQPGQVKDSEPAPEKPRRPVTAPQGDTGDDPL